MDFGTMPDKHFDRLFHDLANRKENHNRELQRIRKENEEARKIKEKMEQDFILERKKHEEEKKKAQEEHARIMAELNKKYEQEKETERLKKLEEENSKKEAIKLAKAPIKKQLKAWVDSFELPQCTIWNDNVTDIIEKFESFKKWSLKQVEEL
jgi:hypothetical protein